MTEQEKPMPDLLSFCKEESLYKFYINKTYSFDMYEFDRVIEQSGSMDCFCIECGQNSVFHKWDYTEVRLISSKDARHYSGENKLCVAKYRCARSLSHHMYFLFYRNNNQVCKIGQYPSMADLATGELAKYIKVLERDLLAEFKRAIGLNAHGIGVGAYVYLRRIFERLVEEAHQKAKSDDGWDEEDYMKQRMGERVKSLSHYLPDFLVENTTIHGILSKGIHELTEEECLEHFHTMKLGIEVILDEKVHEKERAEKVKLATTNIQKTHGQLKQSESSVDDDMSNGNSQNEEESDGHGTC